MLLVTMDLMLVRQMNKALVLSLVRSSSPISRAEVARITGLNKSTISLVAADLIGEQQVVEIGEGHSSGGRRPQLLRFNDRAGFCVGVELGVNYMRGIACDLLGHPVLSRSIDLQEGIQPREAASRITGLVLELTGQLESAPMGILGVGVGVPGTVDAAQGVVLLAPNLAWQEVPLRAMLEQSIGLPIVVENEANAAALGERWFGAGRRHGDLLHVSLGAGVGAGIILGGQLFRGRHGVAGEVGHMTVDAAGPPCACGSRGCWELFTSERALRRDLPDRAGERLSDLVAAAGRGDPAVIAAFHRTGEALGVGLASLVNLFDPELVVVGGPMAAAGPWLLNPAEQAFNKRVMPGPGRATRIVAGDLGADAAALGGAALLLDQRYSLPEVAP